MKLIFCLFWISVSSALYSQILGTQRDTTVKIQFNNQVYTNAWVGGHNYCQFSNIDINNDGIKDLFVFDRSGNHSSLYTIQLVAGTAVYTPDYSQINNFPPLEYWAILRDYNGDGKEDIFTSTSAGIKVYKNTSTPTGIAFTLAKSILYSSYGVQTINIYVKNTEIPGIDDIDGDGDLDIIHYGIFGSCIDYQQNQSQELYGHSDSLVFQYKSDNWGYVVEGGSGINSITLQDSCDGPGMLLGTDIETPQDKHSNSVCMLLFDKDSDGDKDLLLSDAGNTKVMYLRNDGTTRLANMGTAYLGFPTPAQEINLPIFPGTFLVDADADGYKDILASPNTTNAAASQNSIVFLQNDPTNPGNYRNVQNNFLQDKILDLGEGANPTFFDYNGDGLLDIVVGNGGYYNGVNKRGKLALLKNIGTATSPRYEVMDTNWLGVSSLYSRELVPTFGDIDSDGDSDMLLGDYQGRVHLYTNNAIAGVANFVLTQLNYAGIDVGNNAAPQLVDLNRDGLLDIVIGEQNGRLKYYQNTGTSTNPSFTSSPTVNLLGNVLTLNPLVTIFGNAKPRFITINNEWYLFAGCSEGTIYLYDGIENNLTGSFHLLNPKLNNIDVGAMASIAIADINNDTKLDIIVGNTRGGLEYFKGIATTAGISSIPYLPFNIYPNPATDVLSIALQKPPTSLTTLTIYNVVGQQVAQHTIHHMQQDIPIHHLPNGYYLIEIKNEKQEKNVQTIIVTR